MGFKHLRKNRVEIKSKAVLIIREFAECSANPAICDVREGRSLHAAERLTYKASALNSKTGAEI